MFLDFAACRSVLNTPIPFAVRRVGGRTATHVCTCRMHALQLLVCTSRAKQRSLRGESKRTCLHRAHCLRAGLQPVPHPACRARSISLTCERSWCCI